MKQFTEVIDIDSLPTTRDTTTSFETINQPGPSASRLSPFAQSNNIASSSPSYIAPRSEFFNSAISNDGPSGTPYRPLSIDTLVYAIHEEPWPANTAAPYAFIAHTLVTLSETRSRIVIINTLTNCLRTLLRYNPSSLLPALYLLSNTLSPPYSPIELGIGSSVISKAIQHVSGLTPAALKRLYNASGDPGDVAFEAKSNLRTLVPHPPLCITAVYDSLIKIANVKGQGANKQKQTIVEKLLVAAKGEEVRFLVRTLSMNLRVGAVRTSILTALSRAMVLTPPSNMSTPLSIDSSYYTNPNLLAAVKPLSTDSKRKVADESRDRVLAKFSLAESLVKKVFVQHPNYDHIVAGLFEGGLDGLAERVPLTIGIPLHPTLGSPTRSLDEIYDRLGDLSFTAEFKYDGQRAQIHGSKDKDGQVFVRIFSRHLEDMTSKYPDIVSLVKCVFASSPDLQCFIMDAEIVAIDPAHGSLKSFQELSNRARKDVNIQDVKVAVCVFAFDLMLLNGEILLERPFRERRSLLRVNFPPQIPKEQGAARLDQVDSFDSEEGRGHVEDFWMKAVESRCEGLMIKLLDSGEVPEEFSLQKDKVKKKPLPATYEPDKRTSAWLKLKKDYVLSIGDSLDLVPIGAWHGNGRKAGWWSPILLAVRESTTGDLVAVCKCMSGFSDVFYREMKSRFPEDSDTCSRLPQWECITGGFDPDVYFKPREVWEIRGADVTLSPVSLAAMGLVSQTRGLSLRFPRFIRVRDDKSIEHASTSEFLADMWRGQQGKVKDDQACGADDGELVDVDLDDEVEEEAEDT
ncbi:hypothetical protein SERLADRAFT_348456 [Serpula lacrymans var. lacrymans S7.9]|uniref:DNA ligase n=1 Tax=Serpula lacrymans var. lacrymans (strain S7.9) TaxID=578457 RepID=F8NVH9_SERL9|nr:uncharacterized protein SERLADRAFT_348456 [Serpula lacrymans var. lacrymans S7.9]EGO25388.1 hypothetical protein SERLADRAFT_348456 [Serpula lacrymans var. lacrymans S7.9]